MKKLFEDMKTILGQSADDAKKFAAGSSSYPNESSNAGGYVIMDASSNDEETKNIRCYSFCLT